LAGVSGLVPKPSKSVLRSVAAVAVVATGAVMVGAPAGAQLDASQPSRSVSAGPAVAWPLSLKAATLTQQGLDLQLDVKTTGGFSASSIAAQPGRSLCLQLYRAAGGESVRRVCLRLYRGSARLIVDKLSRSGSVVSSAPIKATISRPSPTRMVALFPASDAGLGIGSFRWQTTSTWVDGGGCSGAGCADAVPARPVLAAVKDAVPIGCKATGQSYRLSGNRGRRVVAISFDDGPSLYTRAVLQLLRKHKAHATFFQVGNQMGGNSAVQRQILREGSSIGNHSWSHPVLSGGGSFADSEISRTNARIGRQTGFTPCVFRAPYGAVSSSLIAIARRHGMLTIEWDVDPTDWARPGTGAIISRVLGQTRPGSIILMHDAGGLRNQSVAATDVILGTLARRGYKVVSVETLLGLKPVFR